MKKKKYLPLYYKWMEDGKLPARGLCWSIGDVKPHPNGSPFDVIFTNEYLQLFEPEDPCHPSYWGDDGSAHQMYGFNTLRQTILLFMAAMNEEL